MEWMREFLQVHQEQAREHHARVSARAVWANVLVEMMREFCRYIRSKPWSVMLAGDGLETEGLRGRGVGKCAHGDDV